jgi:hypothetical protein
MSDTPRTDEEAGHYDGSGCWKYNVEGECVTSDFARQLERKLTTAQIGAARYEYLRKLNPREFFDLYSDCLTKDLNFDVEVDRRRTAK